MKHEVIAQVVLWTVWLSAPTTASWARRKATGLGSDAHTHTHAADIIMIYIYMLSNTCHVPVRLQPPPDSVPTLLAPGEGGVKL